MIKVLDLSHHNLREEEGDRYDYAEVAKHVDGIILKCTDPEMANGGHDPTHDYSFEGFVAAGLPVAEYHFHDPSTSPQDNIALYMRHTRRGFIDVLDVEDQEHLSNSALTEHVINTLKEGADRTGRKWWLYTNLDFLNNRLLDPHNLAANFVGIWLAWPSPQSSTFPKPRYYTKDAVCLWQKSWWYSVPGINDTTVDYNEWQWTNEQWLELIGDDNVPITHKVTIEVPREADIIEVQIKRM